MKLRFLILLAILCAGAFTVGKVISDPKEDESEIEPFDASWSKPPYGPDCEGNPYHPVMFAPMNGISFGIAGSPDFNSEHGDGIDLLVAADNRTSETFGAGNCDVHFLFSTLVYNTEGVLVEKENCTSGCRWNGGGDEVLPHQCLVASERGGFDPIYLTKLPKGEYDLIITGCDIAPKHKPDGPSYRLTVP